MLVADQHHVYFFTGCLSIVQQHCEFVLLFFPFGKRKNNLTCTNISLFSFNKAEVVGQATNYGRQPNSKLPEIRINTIKKDKILITYLNEKYWVKRQ